ncbi:uncharacterized protein LOC127878398 [Dreissena polymorpha]|nr:uncharacterized protein LOC127878398 [Dreissena polymorpha]
MGKKRLIEILTVNTDDKLEQNGALRNVAVKDAWQRLRQKIDVNEWKEADKVLQELSWNLQKINLFKAVSSVLGKLKAAFQNPDQFVEENDYSSSGTPTPRDKEQTTQLLHMTSDMTRAKDDMDIIRACLETVKTKLEKENTVPENIDTPVGASMDVQSCFQVIVSICERCHKNGREIEQLKRKTEAYEAKNKDLEKETSEKQEQIDR